LGEIGVRDPLATLVLFRLSAGTYAEYLEALGVALINDEHRHTSMIATLRKAWDLGEPFTARDAAARTFDHLLSRATPPPGRMCSRSRCPPSRWTRR
jgi:hypothetical protein